jgi:hypothetical protein
MKMKQKALGISAAVALAIIAFALPAMAGSSDSTSLTLSGTAGNVCKLSGQTVASANDNSSYANGIYSINAFIDANTAFPKASSGTITLTQAYCNYGTTIEITSDNKGLKNTGTQVAPSDFLTHVDYTVTASWGAVTLAVLDTASTPNAKITQDTGAANKGDIVLTIATPTLQVPALAGEYNDTIRIKIGASI